MGLFNVYSSRQRKQITNGKLDGKKIGNCIRNTERERERESWNLKKLNLARNAANLVNGRAHIESEANTMHVPWVKMTTTWKQRLKIYFKRKLLQRAFNKRNDSRTHMMLEWEKWIFLLRRINYSLNNMLCLLQFRNVCHPRVVFKIFPMFPYLFGFPCVCVCVWCVLLPIQKLSSMFCAMHLLKLFHSVHVCMCTFVCAALSKWILCKMLSYIIVIVQSVFIYGRPNSNNPVSSRNVVCRLSHSIAYQMRKNKTFSLQNASLEKFSDNFHKKNYLFETKFYEFL